MDHPTKKKFNYKVEIVEFHNFFTDSIQKVNSKSHSDNRVQQALREYQGRSFVLKVRNDAIYVFNIHTKNVEYILNPSSIPNDMYAEMDMPQAIKLVYKHTLGLIDLITITHRNITLHDVNFAKMLFGGK